MLSFSFYLFNIVKCCIYPLISVLKNLRLVFLHMEICDSTKSCSLKKKKKKVTTISTCLKNPNFEISKKMEKCVETKIKFVI